MTHRELWKAGCSVIPCFADKSSKVSWKEFQQRRASEEEVTAWERSKPPLWGLVCGKVSGVICLDFDIPHGKKTMHGLGLSPHVQTPSKGHHVYFIHPGEPVSTLNGKIKQELGLRYPCMDVRADGGYACCEGQTADGKYEWLRPFEPDPWDSLPKDLREMLTGKSKPQAVAQNTQSDVPERDSDAVTGKRVESDVLLHRALEQSPSGRNNAAFWLVCQCRDNGHSETEARTVLLDFSRYCGPTDAHGRHEPLTDAEIEATLSQAFSRAPREPWSTAGPKQNPGTAGAEGAHRSEVYSDLWNAERLIEEHGNNLRFNVDSGNWLQWNGTRWETDATFAVNRFAQEVIRRLYDRLARLARKSAEELFAHAKKSESLPRLEAMTKLAQTLPGVPIRAAELDSDPMLLNVLNGVVDLRNGSFRPHRQDDLMTKLAPVEYRPQSTATRWESFSWEVFNGDADLIDFTRRMVGYCATGDTREESVFILVGKGANGKSVFLRTLAHILGDYTKDTPFSTFVERNDSNTADLAALVGARMVSGSEGEHRQTFNESLIKRLSGRDPVTCRYLFKNYFTYTPTFKIVIASNELPSFRSQTTAIMRRVKILRFGVKFHDPHTGGTPVRDDQLSDTLMRESSGILNWIIQGCLEWQAHGLTTPACVRQETEALFESMDPLSEFLEERCEIHPEAIVETGKLWQAYLTWCEAHLRKPAFKTHSWFARNLTQREGIDSGRGIDGSRILKGIGLFDGIDGILALSQTFPMKGRT